MTPVNPIVAVGLAACLTAQVGCTSLARRQPDGKPRDGGQISFLDRMPWKKSAQDAEPEPYPNPVKVAATWTPDTLVQTGRTPTRGFGGRIFFYNEKSQAVPVEGTLIVHGFDDAAETQENRVKRFEFTPEQFTRHFSQSDLGASYSVWIPWDAIGGQQRRISLVTSFRTVDGKTVQGIPATVLLPGAAAEPTVTAKTARLSPQYQRHLQAAQAPTSSPSGMTTTTIARRSPLVARGQQDRAVAVNSSVPTGDSVGLAGRTPSAELRQVRPRGQTDVRPASAQVSFR